VARNFRDLVTVSVLALCLLRAWPGTTTLNAEQVAGDDEATRKLASATLVTLNVKDVPAHEAYQKLVEASGMAVSVPASSPRNGRAMGLSVVDEPYWKAFEELERAAPVNLYYDRSRKKMKITWRDSRRAPYVTFTGPARIRAEMFQVRRKAHQDSYDGRAVGITGPGADLDLTLEIEPRIRVERAYVQLDEMLDDTGTDLLLNWPTGERTKALKEVRSLRSLGQPVLGRLRIPVGFPSAKAKRLQTVRGKVVMHAFPELEPIRVSLAGAARDIRYGRDTLILAETEGASGGEHTLTFTASSDDFRNRYGSLSNSFLVNEEGVKSAPRGVGMRSKPGEPTRYRIKFYALKGGEPTALELIPPSSSRQVSLEFEFKDLPLPPLASLSARSFALEERVEPPRPADTGQPDGVRPLEELAGRTFKVIGDDMPIWDILVDVRGQTGSYVEAPHQEPKRLTRMRRQPIKASPNFDGIRFWRGLDELASLAGMTVMVPNGSPHRGLLYRKAVGYSSRKLPKYVQYLGALRIHLTGVGAVAESGITYRHGEHYVYDKCGVYLNVSVSPEPGVGLMGHAMSTEAVFTGDGRDLISTLPAVPERDRSLRHPAAMRLKGLSTNLKASAYGDYPMKDGRLPDQFKMARFYYLIKTAERLEVEIADAARPSVHTIDKNTTLRWLGLIEPERVSFEIESREPQVVWSHSLLFRKIHLKLFDKQGKSISQGGGSGTLLRRKQRVPRNAQISRALVSLPKNIRAYGGPIIFRDIPIPPLPEPAGSP